MGQIQKIVQVKSEGGEEREYIQLPPLPRDFPLELIDIIWLTVKLPKKERELYIDFIRKNTEYEDQGIKETELIRMIKENQIEPDTELAEIVDLMRKLIGTLMAQACDMAARVYQGYCIEKRSPREFSKDLGVDQHWAEVLVQYYDKKTE